MKKIFSLFFCALCILPSGTAFAQSNICPSITQYLTIGSRSAQVISLKKYLTAQGMLAGVSNTNYFGPSTAAALKTWQKKKGIDPTGATGPKTRAALKNCKATVAVTPQPSVPKITPPPVKPTPRTTPPVTVPPRGGGEGNTPSCTPETQTRQTNCPQGQTGSITETRTAQCPDKTWSAWVETGRTCTTPPSGDAPKQEPKSCMFNGKSVAHTASITAYEKATVPSGQTCKSEQRTCTDGVLSGTYSAMTCAVLQPVATIEIPMPQFPSFSYGAANTVKYISNGDIYLATKPEENGAAITSLIRNGFEYVINDPPATPQYRRGGSWQGSFFFDSPIDSSGGHTFYNDCNNPLETGSVADFTTSFKGITSPTNLYSPSANILQSNAQLAYYVDPYGPTDWVNPTNHAQTGVSATCVVGMINNPRFTVQNNAALSNVFLGKTMTLTNIGTTAHPVNIPGVIAIDMVMNTDKTYTYSGLHPAFASFPSSLSQMVAYDPRTKTTVTPSVGYGRNPVIAHTPDGARAIGIYTPQVALEGEVSAYSDGYLRTAFSTGLNTMMPYIRYNTMPAGSYKFKSYYIVGSLSEVQVAIDKLHTYFKILDPKVFNWTYYVSTNGLGGMSEDQARLHWITTGIQQGLPSSPSFAVKKYMETSGLTEVYGTNYYAAVLNYLK